MNQWRMIWLTLCIFKTSGDYLAFFYFLYQFITRPNPYMLRLNIYYFSSYGKTNKQNIYKYGNRKRLDWKKETNLKAVHNRLFFFVQATHTYIHPCDRMSVAMESIRLALCHGSVYFPFPAPSTQPTITLQRQINHHDHMWWCHFLWGWKGGASHVHLLWNIPLLEHLHGCQTDNETPFFFPPLNRRTFGCCETNVFS